MYIANLTFCEQVLNLLSSFIDTLEIPFNQLGLQSCTNYCIDTNATRNIEGTITKYKVQNATRNIEGTNEIQGAKMLQEI